MPLQTIVLITLGAMLVFWAVGAYNRLVRLKNIIANAFGQIEVHLNRRHDLVANLVETAQKYLPPEREQETLEAVMAARNQARSASDAVRSGPGKEDAVMALAAAEQALDNCLGRLFAMAQTYPKLKADPSIQGFSEELTSTEIKLGFARQAYNDAVLDSNNAQGQFPALLIARMCGFTPSALLPATQSFVEHTGLV